MYSRSLKKFLLVAFSGINLLLLVLYAVETKLVPTPQAWIGSFSWEPAPSQFSLPALVQQIGSWVWQGVVFAGWLVTAWWLGRGLMRRWFTGEARDAGEEAILAVGLGFGAFSLAGFALGAAHLLHPVVIGLSAIAALAAAVGLARNPTRGTRPQGGEAGSSPLCQRGKEGEGAGSVTRHLRAVLRGDGLFFVPAITLCLVSLGFHLLGILTPPIAFDEMSYQLALPRLYLTNHGFVNTPFNHLSYLPQNIAMLFVLGLASGGFVTAKLFSLTLAVLTVCGIFVFGRRWVGGKASLAGAVLFMLTPVIGNQFRLAISDPGAGFYELTGLFLFVRWLGATDRSRLLLLSSVFWGLALGAKYTAIPGYLIAASLLVGGLVLQHRRSLIRGSLCRFTLPALLLWSPWLVKNWWYTGNPVAPLLSTWLPSRNFIFAGAYIPQVDYVSGRGIPQYFPFEGLADLFALPWRLATRYNDFNHDLGPVLLLCLVLLPLAFVRLMRTRKLLTLITALYWLAWLVTGVRMTRYFTAGLALSSLLGGAVIAGALARERRWVRVIVFLPFLVALGVHTMRVTAYQNTAKKPWGYLAARCSAYDYLDRMIRPDSPLRAYRFMNETLPPDATVLVAQEFRTLYLERNFLAATPWDHDYWHEFVRLSRDPGDLARRLRERRVTHVFINTYYLGDKTGKAFLSDWQDEDLRKSRRFLLECFEPLFFEDGLWVGRVKES